MKPQDDEWLDPTELTDNRRVVAALKGETGISDLSQAELGLFYDLIGMVKPRPEWRPHFALRRRQGFGVDGSPVTRRTWGSDNAPANSPPWVEEMLDLFDSTSPLIEDSFQYALSRLRSVGVDGMIRVGAALDRSFPFEELSEDEQDLFVVARDVLPHRDTVAFYEDMKRRSSGVLHGGKT